MKCTRQKEILLDCGICLIQAFRIGSGHAVPSLRFQAVTGILTIVSDELTSTHSVFSGKKQCDSENHECTLTVKFRVCYFYTRYSVAEQAKMYLVV